MDKILRFRESVTWSFIAHLLFFVIILGVILLENVYVKIGFSAIGLTYFVYYLFFRKYNEKELFVNSLLLFFIVIHIGIVGAYHFDIETTMVIGIVVSIQDVLSFTKFGKWTTNARAMSNTNFMAKLILYFKSIKDGHLIPIKGMGDFLFYSLWISKVYYYKSNIQYLLIAFAAVFIGTSIDYVIISKIYMKEKYTGFPATIIPFICLLPIYIICILEKQ